MRTRNQHGVQEVPRFAIAMARCLFERENVSQTVRWRKGTSTFPACLSPPLLDCCPFGRLKGVDRDRRSSDSTARPRVCSTRVVVAVLGQRLARANVVIE